MLLEIEISNYPNQNYSVKLNKQSVVIHLMWNHVDGHGFWTFTLKTMSGAIITAGRRIKSGFPIMIGVVDGFFGNFVALPITIPEEELGSKPWGITHVLMYTDSV